MGIHSGFLSFNHSNIKFFSKKEHSLLSVYIVCVTFAVFVVTRYVFSTRAPTQDLKPTMHLIYLKKHLDAIASKLLLGIRAHGSHLHLNVREQLHIPTGP